MPTGTIKKFFAEKGFGFLSPDGGDSDVFAHARQFDNGGDTSNLREGMKVTFETEWDAQKGKSKAASWSLCDSGGSGMTAPGGMGAPRPAAYGAPQMSPLAGAYGMPPMAGFGAPAMGSPPMGYGAAPQGAYGAPAASPYGMPPAGPYGMPPAGGFGGMPMMGKGGGSGFSPYGAPAAAPMGGPAPGAYSPSPAPGYGAPAPAPVQGGGDPALPPGWEQAADPSSGKPYYCNRATGETSWTPPVASSPQTAAQAAPVPAPAPAPVAPAARLPEGWESAPDPSTGKPYYFNRASGETRWDAPGC